MTSETRDNPTDVVKKKKTTQKHVEASFLNRGCYIIPINEETGRQLVKEGFTFFYLIFLCFIIFINFIFIS